MKRILFVVVVGCFLFSSCGDFLEEYSKDLVYASSCEDLDEIIIGNGYMKRNANQEYAYYRENELYYPYLHVMDDDVEEFLSGAVKMLTNANPAVRYRNFYTWGERPFSDMTGVELVDSDWKRLYEHIGYVNVIISYVKEFESDPEEIRHRIAGEAQFLRGWYYYMLVNLYAKPYSKETAAKDLGVPLNVTEFIEDKYFSRDPVEKVYEQIVSDLKNAADNLAGIVQPTFYRVNEAAARTLLSRVYLYMGEWQLAIDECDKVLALGCKLRDMNGLDEKWLNTVNSPEILFTQGSYAIGGLMNNNLSRYGVTGGGRYRVSDELLALYKKYKNDGVVDLRESVFLEPSSSYCPGYFFIRKTPDYSNNRKGSVKVYDACLIRSAEVYLNKAEAQAMLDQPDAISTVKVLMEKRYKDSVLPAIDGLKGKELVDFIREERRRELTCEGHRWFDLRRYAVSPKYPELKEIMHGVYQSAMASLKPGVYDGSYTLKPYGQDNAWVLPIPDYEIIFDRGPWWTTISGSLGRRMKINIKNCEYAKKYFCCTGNGVLLLREL